MAKMPAMNYPRFEPLVGDTIQRSAERAVKIAKTEGKACHFSFNEIDLVVLPSAAAGDVVADYHRQLDEHRAVYEASPEYKERVRQDEERARVRAAKLADGLASAPASMTVRNAEAWNTWKTKNVDPYGAACLTYAERWARLMEAAIAKGATVTACAKDLSHVADEEGITGFMYGAAVACLAECWTHGEELRVWHNAEYGVGKDSAGVVNPAVLTVRSE
jgi:hypothetical protein